MNARTDRPAILALLGGLVAVCALGAVIASNAGPRDAHEARALTERDSTERERANTVADLGAAGEAVLLARRGDSLRRVLARHDWPSDSLLILEDSLLPAWRLRFEERFLRASWAALAPKRGGVRVAVAIVHDSGSSQDAMRLPLFERNKGFILPSLLDHQTCLVLLQRSRIHLSKYARTSAAYWMGDTTARLTSDPSLLPVAKESSLGACGLIAAHGMPGAGMRDWLDHTGWRATLSPTFADWPHAREPWRAVLAEFRISNPLLAAFGLINFGDDLLHVRAQACAARAPGACRSFVNAGPGRAMPTLESGLIVAPQAYRDVGNFPVLALDPRPRLLDDLRREIGAEKFGALWRDERALPEAFATRVGVPMDEWIGAWTARSITIGDPGRGAMPGLREVFVAALPGLVLMIVALAWFRTRTSDGGR